MIALAGGAPADAAEAETGGLLRGEEEHLDWSFRLEPGPFQSGDSGDWPQDAKRAVVRARQRDCVRVRPRHHRRCPFIDQIIVVAKSYKFVSVLFLSL